MFNRVSKDKIPAAAAAAAEIVVWVSFFFFFFFDWIGGFYLVDRFLACSLPTQKTERDRERTRERKRERRERKRRNKKGELSGMLDEEEDGTARMKYIPGGQKHKFCKF
jgi:hypothetical protein